MKSNSIINSIIKRRLMKHTKKQSTGKHSSRTGTLQSKITGDTYPDGDVLLIRKLTGGITNGHI